MDWQSAKLLYRHLEEVAEKRNSWHWEAMAATVFQEIESEFQSWNQRW